MSARDRTRKRRPGAVAAAPQRGRGRRRARARLATAEQEPESGPDSAAARTRQTRRVSLARGSRERWRKAAAGLPGAVAAPMPEQVELQLATLRAQPPAAGEWLYEVLWDGHRLLARLQRSVRLEWRDRADCSARFPALLEALGALPARSALLDGELIALDLAGRSDRAELQRRLRTGQVDGLRYVMFDLLYLDGIDLRGVAQAGRCDLLRRLLESSVSPLLALSEHVQGSAEQVLAASARAGLGGIVCKRADAPYRGGRQPAWIKLKHAAAPAASPIARAAGAEAGAGQPTQESSMRQSRTERSKPERAGAQSGQGKPAAAKAAATPAKRSRRAAAPRLTHPERVVYPDAGIRKGDVADYYRAVAGWLLPDLIERPLSLLRCPDGIDGECFFQKHYNDSFGPHVHAVELAESDGRADYVYVRDIEGVLALVQMNAIEFHLWGARRNAPDRPDRLVFDLDPAEGVAWRDLKHAAREVRRRLAESGLDSWVRLSGGKGVHVVAPIRPGPDWAAAKAFCEALADAMVADAPQRYVATASKALRKGRIFIDWLRNARGATSIASWSLRARAGAPVAMPLRWDEFARSRAATDFDLAKAVRRAARLGRDPWEGYAESRQRLPGA